MAVFCFTLVERRCSHVHCGTCVCVYWIALACVMLCLCILSTSCSHTYRTHTHTHTLTHTHTQHCFEICLNEKLRRGTLIKACKTNADGKVVVGHHLHYRIQASSEDEMAEWMKRIRASISRNPFLEMLQQRRQRVSKKGPVGL